MQSNAVEDLPITCCGIVCDRDGLSELDSGSVLVRVGRAEIQRIVLKRGLKAPHPILQVVMGLLLASVAYFPAKHFIHWIRHGGVLLSLEVWVMPLAFIGLWLIVSAFRRGYFLEIETTQGRKRLEFQHSPEGADLSRFLSCIERSYGTRVEREVDVARQ